MAPSSLCRAAPLPQRSRKKRWFLKPVTQLKLNSSFFFLKNDGLETNNPLNNPWGPTMSRHFSWGGVPFEAKVDFCATNP